MKPNSSFKFSSDAETNQEQYQAVRPESVQNPDQSDPGTPKHLGGTSELVAQYSPGDYYLITETGGTVCLYKVLKGKLDQGSTNSATYSGDAAIRTMQQANRKLWDRKPAQNAGMRRTFQGK